VAYPYPQAPVARTRPTVVTVATNLLYLVAAVQVVAAVNGLSVVGRMSTVVGNAYTGTAASAAKTAIVGTVVFSAVVEILFGAGLAILAIFNNRGKQGSRITTWVIGGIALCCNGLGVLGSGSSFQSRLDPGNGGPSSAELQRQIRDALPSWYTGISILLAVVSLLALLAVIILLALPAANQYFRPAVVAGVWDPSMQYGGVAPYGAQSPYPYPAQPPYSGPPPQQFPGQPVYPGQPPVSGAPTSGQPVPGQPSPGQPSPGQPQQGQPQWGQPQQTQPPPEQHPHTGSIPPTDPWNGDRPPPDPTSRA
jgi:hypothetical protein